MDINDLPLLLLDIAFFLVVVVVVVVVVFHCVKYFHTMFGPDATYIFASVLNVK